MAQRVTNLENEKKDAKNKALARASFAPFRFAGAAANEAGAVENRYVADGAEVTLGSPAACRAEIEVFFKDSSCSSRLVFIQEGGTSHHLLVRADGGVLMRVTVDSSFC